MLALYAILLTICVSFPVSVGRHVIYTMAGTQGTSGSRGDGGPSTAALLSLPDGIIGDTNANLYVTLYGSHTIRKISLTSMSETSGTIYLVAGSPGSSGTTGDGGDPTSAKLKNPFGIVIATNGDLYWTETNNYCIRKISTSTGKISTYAGTIGSIATSAAVSGNAASSSKLGVVFGIAIDTLANIYAFDYTFAAIYKVLSSDSSMIKLAGTGSRSLSGDNLVGTSTNMNTIYQMWIDMNGNLYFGDSGNCVVRRYHAIANTISTVVGYGCSNNAPTSAAHEGVGTSVGVSEYVLGITGDSEGSIYFADSVYGEIRRYTPDDQQVFITTGNYNGFTDTPGNGANATEYNLYNVANLYYQSMHQNFYFGCGNAHVVRMLQYRWSAPRPTQAPTFRPTGQPSGTPSSQPSGEPSEQPVWPSSQPSAQPTVQPSTQPTLQPTRQPSAQPTGQPTMLPSSQPSGQPTVQPSGQPSRQPSRQPTAQPTVRPSSQPSSQPSTLPTSFPSAQPSLLPSTSPTGQPMSEPTSEPTGQPTTRPSKHPTIRPTRSPSMTPSRKPTATPSTRLPTCTPTRKPTLQPSDVPTRTPTIAPTLLPSTIPPTVQPSIRPTTNIPSMRPSLRPTRMPTGVPTRKPTNKPSVIPTERPSYPPDQLIIQSIMVLTHVTNRTLSASSQAAWIDTIANVTNTGTGNTVLLQVGDSAVMQSITVGGWWNMLSMHSSLSIPRVSTDSIVYYTLSLKAMTIFPISSESSISSSSSSSSFSSSVIGITSNTMSTNEKVYLQFRTALLLAVQNGTFTRQLQQTVQRLASKDHLSSSTAASELQSVQIHSVIIQAMNGNDTFHHISSSNMNDDTPNMDKLHPILMVMVIGGVVGMTAVCITCAFVCYVIARKRQLRRMRVYAAELLDESIAAEEEKKIGQQQQQKKMKLKKQVSFGKNALELSALEEGEEQHREGGGVLAGELEEGVDGNNQQGRKNNPINMTTARNNRVGLSPPSLSPSNSNKMMTTGTPGNEQAANKRVTSPMLGRRSS